MKKQLTGRSMIEMLGVLAIIGVLSIGGLAAYRMAVTKYQTNQILDFIHRIQFSFFENCILSDTCKFTNTDYSANRKLLCTTAGEDMCGADYDNGTYGYYPHIKGATWTSSGIQAYSGNYLNLYFNFIPSKVCVNLVSKEWDSLYSVYVNRSAESYPVQENGKLSDTDREKLIKNCNEAATAWISLQFKYSKQ